MSATCPAGHASATADYCDVCGARIGLPAGATETPPRPDTSSVRDTSATPVTAPCPRCGAARAGQDRFCEDCGFDFVAGDHEDAGPAAAWAATVGPDRDYFERAAPEGLAFPGKRKEPLIDASHVRNAVARFDQVEDVSDAERDQAFANIKLAARHYGVDVTESNWHELGKPA